MKKEIKFDIDVFDSIGDLNEPDAMLLRAARKETGNAYAPYSNFKVGAVARLTNGEIIRGTNQENASFPAGICAERVLLSTAASLFPEVGIKSMAISYDNLNGESSNPASPCGICRQSLKEFQDRTNRPIRLILSGLKGQVFVLQNAEDLLPLAFSVEDMK